MKLTIFIIKGILTRILLIFKKVKILKKEKM